MRRARPGRRDGDAGVLPLINVVFLLLIFFMVAARLAPPEPFAVAPPRSAASGDAPTEAALVTVAADGRMAVDGVALAPVSVAAAVAGRDVRLLADAQAGAGAVITLIGRIRAGGGGAVTLVTAPPEQGR